MPKAAEPQLFMIPYGYKYLGGYPMFSISNHSHDYLFFITDFQE